MGNIVFIIYLYYTILYLVNTGIPGEPTIYGMYTDTNTMCKCYILHCPAAPTGAPYDFIGWWSICTTSL